MIAGTARAVAVAAVLLVVGVPVAEAGRSCEASRISATDLAGRADWTVEILRRLTARDVELAVIARVGSDLTDYGLRYTHAAFVWRDHPKGRWSVVHALNSCGAAVSHLYDQGLLNFLLDDPFALDILILVPSVALQKAIVGRLAAGTSSAYQGRRYSMLAYPFSARYQNSNQWLLEVLAAAQSDLAGLRIRNREQAQSALRARGYRGTAVRLSPMTRVLARLTRDNIAFDDHPPAARRRGVFETITVRSIHDYLRKSGDLVRAEEMIYSRPERLARRRP